MSSTYGMKKVNKLANNKQSVLGLPLVVNQQFGREVVMVRFD